MIRVLLYMNNLILYRGDDIIKAKRIAEGTGMVCLVQTKSSILKFEPEIGWIEETQNEF